MGRWLTEFREFQNKFIDISAEPEVPKLSKLSSVSFDTEAKDLFRENMTPDVAMCTVCQRYPEPWGYDVFIRRGRLGKWYCSDHKPRKDE